jgi:hypothetical protein
MLATMLGTATDAIEARFTLRTGRPLQDALGDASYADAYRVEGDIVSFGLFVRWNADPLPVVLTSIRPIGAVGSPRIFGTGVGGPSVGFVDGFPPPRVTLVPVHGFVVEPGQGPGDGVQIVVGLRTSAGFSGILAFALDYSVAGQRYWAILLQGASTCGEAYRRTCRSGERELGLRQRALTTTFAPFVEGPDRSD